MTYDYAIVNKGDYRDASLLPNIDAAIKAAIEDNNVVIINHETGEGIGLLSVIPMCEHGYYPYCPSCPNGGELITETETEFYRVDGECKTEWYCRLPERPNKIKLHNLYGKFGKP